MEFLTLLFGTLCRQSKIKFNHCITSDADDFLVKLNLLRDQAEVIDDEEVRNLVYRSIGYLKIMMTYVHEYDFKSVPCNGFRSLVLIAYHSIKYGLENWQESDENFCHEFKVFLTSHLDNYYLVERLRAMTKGKNYSLTHDEQFCQEILTRYCTADCDTLEPLYSKFAGLIHGPDSVIRMCTKLFHMFLLARNPSSLLPFKFITQAEFYVPKLDRLIRDLKLSQLPTLDSGVMTTLVRNTYTLFAPSAYISDFTLGTTEVCSEYVIKVDYDQSTVRIGYEENRKPTKCRCLIVRKSNKLTGNESFAGNIILYLHGGAWSFGTPELQLAFLPRWTHMMPGLTILCPQQLRSPDAQFPEHLQQYVDLYMWLTKSPKKELSRALGLSRVSSIIIAGDSSGGMNAINLLYILNDIKNGFNCMPGVRPYDSLFMPYSLHLYFPALAMNKVACAGYLIFPHHWFLNPGLIRSILFCYVRHKDVHNLVEYKSPSEYSHEDSRKFSETMTDFILDHPYCNPGAYGNFSSLKSTPLHILTVPSDVWIDHIVCLLRKWTGECSLNTVHMPHAFLVMPFLGKPYDQVVDTLGEKLKLDFLKALTLHKPEIFRDFNYN